MVAFLEKLVIYTFKRFSFESLLTFKEVPYAQMDFGCESLTDVGLDYAANAFPGKLTLFSSV